MAAGETFKSIADAGSLTDGNPPLGTDVLRQGAEMKAAQRLGEMNPVAGVATVASGTASIVVTFAESRADAAYHAFLTFASSPGSAAKLFSTQKTTDGFTINVDVDPGVNADVDWLVTNF